jgi:hypothetical protein
MKKSLKRQRRINRPYHIINGTLAGIISMVFIYSGLFSAKRDNHPIPSFYERITGEPSPSSGMSRAFSEIIRGNLDTAKRYNPDSLLLFSFFGIQLLQRLCISLLLVKNIPRTPYLMTADLITSLGLFLYCFKGQLCAMGKLMLS